jgi:transcriptional regulator with XRE-family HTH domain
VIAGQTAGPPSNRLLYGAAFACVLKELRTQHNLTTSEAAERVGINRRSWSRYEAGSYVPLVAQIVHFATAFDMDPTSLYQRLIQYRDEFAQRQIP